MGPRQAAARQLTRSMVALQDTLSSSIQKRCRTPVLDVSFCFPNLPSILPVAEGSMMLPIYFLTFLLAAATHLRLAQGRRTTDSNNIPRNAVLLSQVTSLTLHDGKLTNARRSSAVPQLK